MNLELFKEKFGEAILDAAKDKGQAVLKVTSAKLHEVLKFCKEDKTLDFNLLLDVIGVDYLSQSPRFEVIYLLYSIKQKHRLRIKVGIEESQNLATASDLWASADWAEREIFDMFGIKFSGHPNLKRILMFASFEGHPLRKDYPVAKRQKIPEIEENL